MNFVIANFSQFQTKESIIKAMKCETFKENPLIDLLHPITQKYGTPKEFLEIFGVKVIKVTTVNNDWYGKFSYYESKDQWKFS